MWEISDILTIRVGTTVQAAAVGHALALDIQGESLICEIKGAVDSSQILSGAFQPKTKTCTVCDASAFGIGAVLAHMIPDGSNTLSLSLAEKDYSQIKKEARPNIFFFA